ncbi:MAG: ribonuclease P protein component [Clostridia bacterium]|nr:ribonuclease P protein component [Clostridia bacterium]
MKHIAICENHLFSKTYAKGSKFICKDLVVYVLKDLKAFKLMKDNPKKAYVNRVGITVSKKLGGAVVRNRVKRILREGLRQAEKDYNLKKGYLVVLVARNSAVSAKSDIIKKEIIHAMRVLKMINDEKNI